MVEWLTEMESPGFRHFNLILVFKSRILVLDNPGPLRDIRQVRVHAKYMFWHVPNGLLDRYYWWAHTRCPRVSGYSITGGTALIKPMSCLKGILKAHTKSETNQLSMAAKTAFWEQQAHDMGIMVGELVQYLYSLTWPRHTALCSSPLAYWLNLCKDLLRGNNVLWHIRFEYFPTIQVPTDKMVSINIKQNVEAMVRHELQWCPINSKDPATCKRYSINQKSHSRLTSSFPDASLFLITYMLSISVLKSLWEATCITWQKNGPPECNRPKGPYLLHKPLSNLVLIITWCVSHQNHIVSTFLYHAKLIF